MIPYEHLCSALDIYNRKLRGEDVPEDAYQEHDLEDEFDIVESAEAGEGVVGADLGGEFADLEPDVTAETVVPSADFGGYDQSGSGDHAAAAYDTGAVPGQPAETMPSDQYSSGQQVQEGYAPALEPQPEGVYSDDQDPNRRQ